MTKDDLIINNINLANKVARKYYNLFKNIIEYEDLQSLAFIGLVKAANTYKVELNVEFSTYAWKVMANEILAYYKNNKKTFNNLYLSMEIDNNLTINDILADEFNLEEYSETLIYSKQLHKFIKELDEREQSIINYRLNGLTFEGIAAKLSISRQRVHMIYKIIINKLRYKFNKEFGGDIL